MAKLFYMRVGRPVEYDKETGNRLFDPDRWIEDTKKRLALKLWKAKEKHDLGLR